MVQKIRETFKENRGGFKEVLTILILLGLTVVVLAFLFPEVRNLMVHAIEATTSNVTSVFNAIFSNASNTGDLTIPPMSTIVQ